MKDILSGLRILILEDESLIALDVEQLCRDYGASDIVIERDLGGLETESALDGFDVAIVDLMLSGVSALPFAERLRDRNRPFVFTSGFGDMDRLQRAFPGVRTIGKPFSGGDLVEAVAAAAGRL
jgi:DNA-binding response OmpR family regulator